MKNMKFKNLLVVSALGLTMLSLAKPAEAFWPFDVFKKGPKQEMQVGLDSGQAENGFPSLIQKLIDKFNLNPDEVRGVMEETREERRTKNQEQAEEKLNKAVEEGKITEEQRQLILAKHEEIKAKREELKDLSPEERKEALMGQKEELQVWAEENGIDLKQMFPMGPKPGFGKQGGRGKHLGEWGKK